ncbi:hypothetical protein [Idiomarina sp.]|uniref:hypothetical protein n=1 Tax=Idiomarina sp. TaxID=1874361 RepID=UPI00258C270B|nr:hypothetical protein [Idiomarina sp.]
MIILTAIFIVFLIPLMYFFVNRRLATPFLVILTCFFLYFLVPVVVDGLSILKVNDFYSYNSEFVTSTVISYSFCFIFIFLLSFFTFYFTAAYGGFLERTSVAWKDNRTVPTVFIGIFFALCIAVSFPKYASKIYEGTSSIADNAGSGVLLIVGYLGYLIAVNLFLGKGKGSRSLLLALVIAATAIFFFSFGQRGGALYPIAIVFSIYMVRSYTSTKVITVAFLSFPFLILVNFLTSLLRKTIIYGVDVDAFDLSNYSESLPLAFSQNSLLSHMVFNNINDGKSDVLLNSILNWLPRSFFPEKGLSTGPHIAAEILPGVDIYSHSTSLTTGPIIEGYYYGGFFGVTIAAVLLAFTCSLIEIFKFRVQPETYIIFSFLFGFLIFFDDLGGLTSKLVLVVLAVCRFKLFRLRATK